MGESAEKKYSLICFSYLPWGGQWKRNQSMVYHLSKQDFIGSVLFINPSVWPNGDFFKFLRQMVGSVLIDKKFEKIRIITPFHFIPFKGKIKKLKQLEQFFLERKIKKYAGGKKTILFLNTIDSFFSEQIEALIKESCFSFYDFSDDFLAFDYKIEHSLDLEKFLAFILPQVNAVISINSHVSKKYSHYNANSFVLRNATNYENFNKGSYSKVALLEKTLDKGAPVIGFSGGANIARIDVDLLKFVIGSRPGWQFVFVGDVHNGVKEPIECFNNVHFLPPVPYERLADYINYFDICISPLLVNSHTQGNDLLKLHDYLAMGKPVVSTNVGGASDFKEVIQIASGREEFLNLLDYTLQEIRQGDSPNLYSQRRKIAKENSWENRIESLVELIKADLKIK